MDGETEFPGYTGIDRQFFAKMEALRLGIHNDPATASSSAGSYFFRALQGLLIMLAKDEGLADFPCEAERAMVREFHQYARADGCAPFWNPFYYATRCLSRMNYRGVPIIAPAIDVGTGDGVTARFVFGDRRLAVGGDYLLSDLVQCRRFGAPLDHLVSLDTGHLPFADGAFNTVFCMNTIYHVPNRDASIVEMARIVRPGGTLHFDAISGHFAQQWPFPGLLRWLGFDQAAEAFTVAALKPHPPFDPQACEALLRAAGFDQVTIAPCLSLRLFRTTFMFHDGERLVADDGNKRAHDMLLPFLETVVAPLLAQDSELSKAGSAYFVVHARKTRP